MSEMTRTPIGETAKAVGQTVKISGWVQTKRDHGKITFVDLRDRTGVIQCVGYKKMGELTTESVVELVGLVKQRPEKMVNPNSPLGSVEFDVQEYTILNPAKELPIQVEGDGLDVNEEVRLKYRYLDLRRERLRNIVKLRSDYFKALREALSVHEFTEVETPMLTKSTKEGARDFIVPSRLQPGKFYALPQSPQQYKQLLMTAGVERYFQFARCIRDEDLRADRGFEFTQLDLEMSFVKREDVMSTVEKLVKHAVKAVGGTLKDEEFPVFDYKDAMAKFGADKFDLRTEEEKKAGVLSFAWVINFPFFKKVDTSDAAEVIDGKSGWTFTHNPFSAPIPEHEEWLLKGENVGEILTTQYDLVCNGYEAGGGSIRAHRPELLRATFKVMGYSDEEIQDGVGHMLEAFEVGTPPHGGIAFGLDRHVMMLANESSLREVIAFPMSSSGKTAVMDAPSPVTSAQLKELHLSVEAKKASQK
jgi:aspartyl-tRNA synthetase